jgi:predicted acylesterase/phospholipase RssA
MWISRARYISIASAGTRGFAYLGFVEALEDHLERLAGVTFEEWRGNLLGVVGTSAGSIAALIVLLGIDRHSRSQLLRHFSDIRSIVRYPDVSLLMNEYGCDDGSLFKEVVQSILVQGGLSPTSTLRDLKRLLRQDFSCVCTSLNKGESVVLSADNYPDLMVCEAIYASCCIPCLFVPQRVGDEFLVDGALTSSLPRVYDDDLTLFLDLPRDTHETRSLESWGDFLQSMIHCNQALQKDKTRRLQETRPEQCFFLQSSESSPCFDIHLNENSTERMFLSGYIETVQKLSEGRLYDMVASVLHVYVHLSYTVCNVKLTVHEELAPSILESVDPE